MIGVDTTKRLARRGTLRETLSVWFTTKREIYRAVDDAVATSDELMQHTQYLAQQIRELRRECDITQADLQAAQSTIADRDREVESLRQRVVQLEALVPKTNRPPCRN